MVDRRAAPAPAVPASPLDALAAQATAIEQGAVAALPGAAPPEPEPAPPDPVEEAVALVELVWSIAGPFVPDVYAERYTEAARRAIGSTWAKLAEKRGWDAGDMFGRWGEEIAFAAALAGPALPVVIAQRQAVRAARELRRQGVPQPAPAAPAP